MAGQAGIDGSINIDGIAGVQGAGQVDGSYSQVGADVESSVAASYQGSIPDISVTGAEVLPSYSTTIEEVESAAATAPAYESSSLNVTASTGEINQSVVDFIEPQNAYILGIIAELGINDEMAEEMRMELIMNLLANNFGYQSDSAGEGWGTVEHTLTEQSGDCEDLSNLAASLFMAAGFPAEDVNVYVNLAETQGEQGHVVLGVTVNGQEVKLDFEQLINDADGNYIELSESFMFNNSINKAEYDFSYSINGVQQLSASISGDISLEDANNINSLYTAGTTPEPSIGEMEIILREMNDDFALSLTDGDFNITSYQSQINQLLNGATTIAEYNQLANMVSNANQNIAETYFGEEASFPALDGEVAADYMISISGNVGTLFTNNSDSSIMNYLEDTVLSEMEDAIAAFNSSDKKEADIIAFTEAIKLWSEQYSSVAGNINNTSLLDGLHAQIESVNSDISAISNILLTNAGLGVAGDVQLDGTISFENTLSTFASSITRRDRDDFYETFANRYDPLGEDLTIEANDSESTGADVYLVTKEMSEYLESQGVTVAEGSFIINSSTNFWSVGTEDDLTSNPFTNELVGSDIQNNLEAIINAVSELNTALIPTNNDYSINLGNATDAQIETHITNDLLTGIDSLLTQIDELLDAETFDYAAFMVKNNELNELLGQLDSAVDSLDNGISSTLQPGLSASFRSLAQIVGTIESSSSTITINPSDSPSDIRAEITEFMNNETFRKTEASLVEALNNLGVTIGRISEDPVDGGTVGNGPINPEDHFDELNQAYIDDGARGLTQAAFEIAVDTVIAHAPPGSSKYEQMLYKLSNTIEVLFETLLLMSDYMASNPDFAEDPGALFTLQQEITQVKDTISTLNAAGSLSTNIISDSLSQFTRDMNS